MLTVKILDRQTSENIMGMHVDSLAQLKERVFTIFKDPESLLFVAEGMDPFYYSDLEWECTSNILVSFGKE